MMQFRVSKSTSVKDGDAAIPPINFSPTKLVGMVGSTRQIISCKLLFEIPYVVFFSSGTKHLLHLDCLITPATYVLC